MSKRKKKNLITILSLLLALALLIGFYVWYRNNSASKKAGEDNTDTGVNTEEAESLATIDPKLINMIHFTNQNTDMKLVLEGDVWKSEKEPDRPINQSYVQNMIKILSEIKSIRKINQDPEDLSEYGLKDPAIFVEAAQTDGKSISLQMGDMSTGGEGYYALVNEDKTVYLVDITYGTGLDYDESDMTSVEDNPTIKPEEIYHIEVLNRDGEDFELLNDEENKYPNIGNGLFSWKILKPYEEGYTADSSKLSDMLANYTTFSFLTCVDYKGEDLDKYGLDDPAASILVEYLEVHNEELEKPQKDPKTGEEVTQITTKDDKNVKIYIGNVDSAGDYYVRKEGSNLIYTMDKAVIDKMLNTDAFSIMSLFVSIPNIEDVDNIDIQIDGKPYAMEIKRDAKTSYYYNGKEVEEDVFKEVYQALISAGYDTMIKEKDVSMEGKSPLLTITYQLNKGDNRVLSTSYYPYNESFYLVENKGEPIRFYADKRKIDSIIKKVEEFKKFEEN